MKPSKATPALPLLLAVHSLPAFEPRRDDPPIAPEVDVNPLWMIATAMACFFMVAGFVIAFG